MFVASLTSRLLCVFRLQPIKHWFSCERRAAGLACSDIISQRLGLDGLLALGALEQAQSSTDDFADVVEAAAFDLVTDECLEMGAQGNPGPFTVLSHLPPRRVKFALRTQILCLRQVFVRKPGLRSKMRRIWFALLRAQTPQARVARAPEGIA